MKVIAIFLDFKKAFDTVSHEKLLQKLYTIGVRGIPLEWFRSYLSRRKIYTSIKDTTSSTLDLKSGVPQGSILGPLLFIIYINDFHLQVDGNLLHFADDSVLIIKDSNIQTLSTKCSTDLTNVKNWLQQNNMALNTNKTYYMKFGKFPIEEWRLYYDNQQINNTNSIKYLGIHIDSKLNFKDHCKYTYNKLCRYVPVFYNIRDKLNHYNKLTLYNSFVQSTLEYGIEIYGSAKNTHQSKLKIIQNTLLKILFNFPKLYPTIKLYQDINVMTINQLKHYKMACLAWQLNYNPERMITKNISHQYKKHNHKYNIRNDKDYSLYFQKPTHTNSMEFKIKLIWNELPNKIKSIKNFSAFQTEMKQHLTTILN